MNATSNATDFLYYLQLSAWASLFAYGAAVATTYIFFTKQFSFLPSPHRSLLCAALYNLLAKPIFLPLLALAGILTISILLGEKHRATKLLCWLLALFIFILPCLIFLMLKRLNKLDRSVFETAALLGAGKLDRMFSIAIPALRLEWILFYIFAVSMGLSLQGVVQLLVPGANYSFGLQLISTGGGLMLVSFIAGTGITRRKHRYAK